MILKSKLGISFIGKANIERLIYITYKIFPQDSKTLKRLKNLLLSLIAWRYGIILESIKPVILQVEVVRGCNFNCIMCRAGELEKEFMEFEQFKKILDKFEESIALILNLEGEPFLSKDILRMINYASERKKMIVSLFSNFSVIPKPEEIISSGLYEINASIDTFDAKKFSQLRQNGNLKIVLKNLSAVIETRKKMGKSIPIISLNATYSKENAEDAENIIQNSINLGVDRVKFQKLLKNLPRTHVKLNIPGKSEIEHLIKLKDKYRKKIDVILNNFEFSDPKGYCYLAYLMQVIRVNGETYPCCMPHPFLENGSFGYLLKDENRRERFIRDFRKSPKKFCQQCEMYYRK